VAKFDLTFFLNEQRGPDAARKGCMDRSNTLAICLTPPRWSGWRGGLVRLFEAVAADPAQSISQIDLLDSAERRQLLVSWNATTQPSGLPTIAGCCLRRQVERTPYVAGRLRGKDCRRSAESKRSILADRLGRVRRHRLEQRTSRPASRSTVAASNRSLAYSICPYSPCALPSGPRCSLRKKVRSNFATGKPHRLRLHRQARQLQAHFARSLERQHHLEERLMRQRRTGLTISTNRSKGIS